MPAPKRIITLGNAFLDRIVRVPRLLAEPGKLRATGMLETGGGIAATAAYAVARLGGSAACITRIGDDLAGDGILRRLEGVGVDTSLVLRTPNSRSPQGTIIVAPDGERMAFGFMGDAYPDDPAWIDARPLPRFDGLMADYSWPSGASKLILDARRRGAVSVLDADVGDMDAVQALLALPDYIVFSQPCLMRLSGTDDLAEGLRRVAAQTPSRLAVTAGEAGVSWLDQGNVRHAAAFKVDAIDTNGAGDIFHGAVTLALAEGRSLEQALRFASAAAAIKCATGSGWESIPDRAAVDEFLQRRQ